MDWITRREKGLLFVLILIASFWGYWIDGIWGAIIYPILAVVVAGVLYFGLTHGIPRTDVRRRSVAIGAVLLFSVFAVLQYGILPGIDETMELLILGGSSVGIGVGIGYISGDDSTTGLVHGMLTGGVAAFLVVLIAIQQSFSMRPALTGIVVIALVLGPPVLGFLVGIGGAIGGSFRSGNVPKGISD